MSRVVMPRAYIDRILASNPAMRVWPLAMIRGSNVASRSRGVAISISPKSPFKVFLLFPLRRLPFGFPSRAGLFVLDDPGLERGLPLPRRGDLDFAKIPFQSLLAFSVAAVAVRLRLLVMPFISQVGCHLGFQGPFHQGLRQLPQHSVLAGQILRLLVVRQQSVHYFLFNRHGCSPSL